LNGRFLQLDKATEDWEEVSDAVAREKVGSGFRRKQRVRSHRRSMIEDRGDGPVCVHFGGVCCSAGVRTAMLCLFIEQKAMSEKCTSSLLPVGYSSLARIV
jgi:hypothetical protein